MQFRGKDIITDEEFNEFFKKFDANGDGQIEKSEMVTFLKKFNEEFELQKEQIIIFIETIWDNYDVDNNGFLDKRETLKFLNEFMELKEKSSISNE